MYNFLNNIYQFEKIKKNVIENVKIVLDRYTVNVLLVLVIEDLKKV